MAHALQTRLPVTATSLVLDCPQVQDFNEGYATQHCRQQRNFNTRQATRDLCALQDGEEVSVEDTQSTATVLSPAQRPHSTSSRQPLVSSCETAGTSFPAAVHHRHLRRLLERPTVRQPCSSSPQGTETAVEHLLHLRGHLQYLRVRLQHLQGHQSRTTPVADGVWLPQND